VTAGGTVRPPPELLGYGPIGHHLDQQVTHGLVVLADVLAVQRQEDDGTDGAGERVRVGVAHPALCLPLLDVGPDERQLLLAFGPALLGSVLGFEPVEFDLPTVGADEGFRRLLATHPVESIHSADATLEDVFIDVTGKELA
jgi:hypothetical protein